MPTRTQRHCTVCNTTPYDCVDVHENSHLHKMNLVFYDWSQKSKKLQNDRHGVTLSVSHRPENGEEALKMTRKKDQHILSLSPEQLMALYQNVVHFSCNIKNIQNSASITLKAAGITYPYELYSINDPNNCLQNGLLTSGAVFNFIVTYRYDPKIDPPIGVFKIPIYFTFETADDELFTIARNITVAIEYHFTQDILGIKSPFTGAEWGDRGLVVVGPHTKVTVRTKDKFQVPNKYYKCLRNGLREGRNKNETIQTIRRKLEPKYVTSRNYRDYFDILLWMEEIQLETMLATYSMENVTVEVFGKDVHLIVPGLAEKRPSIIVSDLIDLRVHQSTIVYRGIVKAIDDETVEIESLSPDFRDFLCNNPQTELDVRFLLGRINLERMHQGVEQTLLKNKIPYLFPPLSLINGVAGARGYMRLQDSDFSNKKIINNVEQRTAVTNILNCTSGNAPYIVYGPPGTGKTVTIVEAILQILNHTERNILVCAPANAACNMLTEKLMEQEVTTKQMIRIISENAVEDVSDSIKEYVHMKVKAYRLKNYRVVISTLILAGKYTGEYKPDVVFIDEAAQPCEPEACCALGLLSNKGQIVLAGDPNQLGPNQRSKIAQDYGLNVSLLERLIKTELYASGNPKFITMLKENYRSHELILELPNKMFYDKQLKALSLPALFDPVANVSVYFSTAEKKKKVITPGKAIEFCAILARDKREGSSPSYYNVKEIQTVARYVKALIELPLEKGKRVKAHEIGIVAPYIRQVYKIKQELGAYPGVEVGTTETFQGREKRIIIVTTVRGREDLLLSDKQYDLGFVKNEKRFNVAITRAMSKLIVIGNPFVLQYDEKWLEYIEFCKHHKAYHGAPFNRRTEDAMSEIAKDLKENAVFVDTVYEKTNNKKGGNRRNNKHT